MFIFTPALILVHALGLHKDFPQRAVCGASNLTQTLFSERSRLGRPRGQLRAPRPSWASPAPADGRQLFRAAGGHPAHSWGRCVLARTAFPPRAFAPAWEHSSPGRAWNHAILGSLRMSFLLGTRKLSARSSWSLGGQGVGSRLQTAV